MTEYVPFFCYRKWGKREPYLRFLDKLKCIMFFDIIFLRKGFEL